MEKNSDILNHIDSRERETCNFAALLKEMKDGLDVVQSKIQALTAKVKANQFPTADGMSYLEAKHLLLLNYCQSLVYYLLRKAKGFSVEGHPVVRSLVEIRLFLEKIRPIDKKLQYQIQKLLKVSENENAAPDKKESDAPQKIEDKLIYRPNPELIVENNMNPEDNDGVYRPPKILPVSMEDDKLSKHERRMSRKEKQIIQQTRQSSYVRELIHDLEGRPEEIRDSIGMDSREVTRYVQKAEERARQEEELFTRVPLTRMEKKKEKYLKKLGDGLEGLTDSFYDDIKTLGFEDNNEDQIVMKTSNRSKGMKKIKKRKRRH